MIWTLILMNLLASDSNGTLCETDYQPCTYTITYYHPISETDPRAAYAFRRQRTYITPQLFRDISEHPTLEKKPEGETYTTRAPNRELLYPNDSIQWEWGGHDNYTFYREGDQIFYIDIYSGDTLQAYTREGKTRFNLYSKDYISTRRQDTFSQFVRVLIPLTNIVPYYINPQSDYLRYYAVNIFRLIGPTKGFYEPDNLRNSISSGISKKDTTIGKWIEVYHYVHGAYSTAFVDPYNLATSHFTIDSTGDCHCVWESFRRGK